MHCIGRLLGLLAGIAVGIPAEGAAIRVSVREARQPAAAARPFAVPAAPADAGGGMIVSADLRPVSGGLRSDALVRDTTAAQREIVLSYHLTLPGHWTHVFLTDGNGPQQLTLSGSATYRAPLPLPAVTFFGPDEGVTIAAPLEIPAPTLTFSWQRTAQGIELAASVSNLRLAAGGHAVAGLLLRQHEGCWRPGLGWLVKLYPEYFHPPLEKVFDDDGPMIYDFVTPESRLRRDLDQDLKWQELGWYWPHLGLYRPDAQSWRRQPSSEGGLGQGGEVTVPMLNDYIALSNRLGVAQCLYFQSTESWADYAERHFPESRVRNARGELCPTWIKCIVMNPSPDGPFGRHILQQARRLVETFPAMAGVFWDQNAYTGFDFAHDDGISMVNGRPVSMMEFPQNRLLSLAGRYLHERGKVIFTNGGWTAGLARYCDAHMSEGAVPTRRLQYLCMMKHLTLLYYDGTLAAGREKIKLALETGAQPSVTLGNDACRALFLNCRPNFRLLRRKQWVFEPRAIALSDGIRGNIFRTHDGNYLVTAVVDDARPPAFAQRQRPMAVRIRVHDAAEIRQVFSWRSDLQGFRAADIERGPNCLTIAAAHPDPCGALVLARRGRWIASQTAALIAGQKQPVRIVLANLSDTAWSGPWSIAAGARRQSCQQAVPAFASSTITLDAVDVPRDGTRLALEITGPQPDGTTGRSTVEVPVLPGIGVSADPGPLQLVEGESTSYALANHLDRDVALCVTKTWTGKSTLVETADLALKAGEIRILAAGAAVPHAGRWTLKIDARWPEGATAAVTRLDVATTHLPADFRVDDERQLTLQMDVFNSLAGRWAEKPVRIQSLPLGRLPITGSTLKWHEALLLQVPGEAARSVVRNGLQADGRILLAPVVANDVKNCFKVRNVRAILRMQSGETILSSIAPAVHCSTAGWLYAEGTSVNLGQPVPLGELRFPKEKR